MTILKKLLLILAVIITISLLGYSTWHQWNANQGTIIERMKPITPIAQCNHGGWIQDIAFSPVNTDTIATASNGNKVKIWNINNPSSSIMTKIGHAGNGDDTYIDCLAFSPTGEWIASKTYEKLDAWEMSSGEKLISAEIRSFTGAISPVSYRLATALNDVRLWDISNLNEITETVVLSHNIGSQVLTLEEASHIKHLNETVNHRYEEVVFSNEDKWLTASGRFYDRTHEKWIEKVKIWDLQNKQLIKIINREKSKGSKSDKYFRGIESIRFSPNNRFFAITGRYGLTIWTLPEWNIYHEVLDQGIGDIAFSPDGKSFALTDSRMVTLWSIDNLKLIALLKDKRSFTYVDILTFSPDGKYLAAGGYSGILMIWDVSHHI